MENERAKRQVSDIDTENYYTTILVLHFDFVFLISTFH